MGERRARRRVAREWGRLEAALSHAGLQPRPRAADLAIAATARVHHAVLLTLNRRDFDAVAHLVDIRDADGRRPR